MIKFTSISPNLLQQLTLLGGQIGIERETLRCDYQGNLSKNPHPAALGSAFTHPNITIDFAESLLEIVTNPHKSAENAYQQLLQLHQFVSQNLNNEKLWCASMPCVLPDEKDIAIGEFGISNNGKLKKLYRSGLALRYGKWMQMIAGIHFNYSPNEKLFDELAQIDKQENNQNYRNQRYMGMLRTLKKYSWLIVYLFGSSPVCDENFAPAKNLIKIKHQTLGIDNAIALRMSNLGYQNKIDFNVSFNNLADYIDDLKKLVTTTAPTYQKIGLFDQNGNYQQISTNILQIANEYYAPARPKQITKKGELPLIALKNQGIRYIELRITDCNIFDACGISLNQILFLESFMLWALLNPEKPFTNQQLNQINSDNLLVASKGLLNPKITENQLNINNLADKLLNEISLIAENLSINHQAAINQIKNQEILSIQQMNQLTNQKSFLELANQLSDNYKKSLQNQLDKSIENQIKSSVDKSLKDFELINQPSEIAFDDYLKNYFNQLKQIN